MFKVAHECPISFLEESRSLTDYDYALVHLFETHPQYFNYFVESLKLGRTVILDNSIFELGVAFDSEKYVGWINKLNPTHYIVPDAFNDYLQTKVDLLAFERLGGIEVPSKTIGVVQGRTYEELKECYKFMVEKVDKIAFSFIYEYFLEGDTPFMSSRVRDYKPLMYAVGRYNLLRDLLNDGIIDTSKPHHLLGASLPFEFTLYDGEEFNFIESIDTSNPVVAGILREPYHPKYGVLHKWNCKLVDHIDQDLPEDIKQAIKTNISIFRKMCRLGN